MLMTASTEMVELLRRGERAPRRKAGLQPRQAREAAMRQLSSSLPARVVADTLGGSIQAAARWSQLSGGTWKDYPGLRM